jgi:hypothetical protein
MFRRIKQIGLAAAALLVPAVSAQAVVVFATNGAGGWNAYELVNVDTTYGNAISGSQIAFPGAPAYGVNPSGTIGHLATFSGSSDYEFMVAVRQSASQNMFIGLTDDAAFAPLSFENGNNSGGAIPANGVVAVAGQRGAGWAVVSGPLNTFHQRTPGVSIWGGGEPNDAGGEDAAELRQDGFLNDIPVSAARPYLREWDLNLTNRPIVGNEGGLGFAGIREVNGVGSPGNTTNSAGIVASGLGNITNGTASRLHFFDPEQAGGGQFANGGGGNGSPALPFLTNTGGDDNDFILRANGAIRIDVAGTYTFGFDSDDGTAFQLFGANFTKTGGNGTAGGDIILFNDPTGSSFTLASTFLDAGVYEFEITFFENGGGAFAEYFAAQGSFSSFDGNAFRIIGDTEFGGLALVPRALAVPEPASAMLGMLGLSLLGLRRRRTA